MLDIWIFDIWFSPWIRTSAWDDKSIHTGRFPLLLEPCNDRPYFFISLGLDLGSSRGRMIRLPTRDSLRQFLSTPWSAMVDAS